MASAAAASGRYGWLPGKEVYKGEFESARTMAADPTDRDKERLKAGKTYGGDRFQVVEDSPAAEIPDGYEEIAYFPAAEEMAGLSSMGQEKRVKLLRKSAAGSGVSSMTAMPSTDRPDTRPWEQARLLAQSYSDGRGTGWMSRGTMLSDV